MKTEGRYFIVLMVAFIGVVGYAEPMRMVVPRAAKPPVIDGKIQQGEWDDAVAVSGVINQFDGLAHPRQATFWMTYDGTHVYLAQRSTLLPGELDGGVRFPTVWFEDNDNSAVFCLAPGRVNHGDEPSHYQLRCNLSGKIAQEEICWRWKGLKLVYPQNRTWNGKWTVANSLNADKTVWESEYAIPLAEMKVEVVKNGEEWGVLFARDYPCLDQNAIVRSTDWRFGPARRHWGLGLFDNYRKEGEYARACLMADAPAVQVLSLGDLAAGKLGGVVSVGSHGVAAVDIALRRRVTQGETVIHEQNETAHLEPGQRKEFPLAAKTIPAGDYLLRLEVSAGEGKPLFAQAVPFRVGYAQERLTRVPDIYFSGEHKLGPWLDATMTSYNPIRNLLIGRVRIGNMPQKEKASRADLSVRCPGEAAPLFTAPLPAFDAAGVSETRVQLPVLVPGLYEVTATVYDAGGVPLGRSRDYFMRYDHAKELPWLGNSIGVSDKVLPPWTSLAMRRDGDGVELRCWGRSYRVDGGGLLTGAAATGEALLAGPARLEVVETGGAVALTADTKPLNVAEAPDAMSFQGELRGSGWVVRTQSRLEYDGNIECRIRLEPQSERHVERIRLRIPLTPAQATHLHAAAGYNMRGAASNIALKPEAGRLWDSGQSAASDYNGLGLLAGNFKPFVWVGNAYRGLAFMADNDQGWVPDETKAVSAIEVERTTNAVSLILNLVARPFIITKPREVVFNLQATPVRPLPDDFRQRRFHILGTMAFCAGEDGVKANDGSYLYQPYRIAYSNPFPLDWDKSREFTQLFYPENPKNPWRVERTMATPYQCLNGWLDPAEVDDPRVPGLQGANLYGYICPDTTASMDMWDGNLTKTDLEYRLWRYQRWIAESGLRGMYFDNVFPTLGANVDAGQGYVLDLPDRSGLHGKIQPGYRLSGMREFFKRLRYVFAEAGVVNPYIWTHVTDTFTINALSFTDFMMDGEEDPQVTPETPSFSDHWKPERMQVVLPSEKWGVPVLFMDRTGAWPPNLTVELRNAFRDMIGWEMLHDSEGITFHYGWPGGLDLARKADFLPYWDPATSSAVKSDRPAVLVSAWRQDRGLMILNFNNSVEAVKDCVVRIDLRALGVVPAPGTAPLVTDVEDGAPETEHRGAGKGAFSYTAAGDVVTIKIDVKPRNYRVLSVR